MAFEFAWPWMAMLLVPPVFAHYLWLRLHDEKASEVFAQQQTLLHPALDHMQQSFRSRRPRTPIASRIYRLLLWLLWILLTLTMMRPQWLEPYTETHAEGYDLMLAVDASHSMEALDFSVNQRQVSRMAVLKGVMDRFIANRGGDRIGLIIFGNQAFTISPLTYDLNAVRQQLHNVNPNIAGQGTAMGDAIALGVKKLRQRPEGSRVLILIADGENTAGTIPPLEAVRLAVAEGVRIYAIGVGSNKSQVPIPEQGRVVMRSDLGLDEALLRSIAEQTVGGYFRATNTAALEEIYRRIDELEKTEVATRTVLIPHPLFQWPLGLALLLLLALGLFPDGRWRAWGGGQHA